MTAPDGNGAATRLSQISAHLSALPSSDLPPPLPAPAHGSPEAPQAPEPSDGANVPAAPPPTLILIFGWTGGSAAHFSLYVQRYEERYPTARILVFPTGFLDLSPWPFATRRVLERGFEDVLHAPKHSVGDVGDDSESNGVYDSEPPRILAHVFSNGGTVRFTYLAEWYRRLTLRPLPVYALIFDSAPSHSGIWEHSRAIVLVTAQLRPLGYAGFGAILLWLSAFSAWSTVTLQREPVPWMLSAVSDPMLVPLDVLRLYIFSKLDALIPWKEVKDHAEEAQRGGYKVRELEMENSGHCRHAKTHPDMYWTAVTSLWNEALASQASHQSS